MPEFDLLSSVQPSDGWFAVLSIKEGKVRQQMVATRAEVDELTIAHVANGRDVYFGVAKFKTDASRQKDNVLALRSLWLDIDCGEAKAEINDKTGLPAGYLDRGVAGEALKGFVKATGLPNPVVVSSGRGLHVYWPLTEDVSREQWEPAAAALQAKCREWRLLVDPAVFEVARVLRIPGTQNFKDTPPTDVQVLRFNAPTPFGELCALLGVDGPSPVANPVATVGKPARLTALAQSLEGPGMVCSFARIIERSELGGGCEQMLRAVKDRATIGYDLWTAALSIANKCQVDRDEGIRMVSDGHPDYDFEEASAKAATFGSPRTCANLEAIDAAACKKCPHKGKIRTPIVLGVVVAAAPEDYTVIVPGSHGVDDAVVKPIYPDPYFWAEAGGVWAHPPDGQGEPKFVYAHHLYVTKRLDDPDEGDVFAMHHHLPNHAVRVFTVTHTQALNPDEMRRALGKKGVIPLSKKQSDLITDYVLRSVAKMQYTGEPTKMRLQFGWADNNTKFVIGDREITTEGVYHTPPSKSTKHLSSAMIPTGSLASWKEVFALYGREGLEPHAFAALTGFGAPLFRYTGQRGGMINVIHPNSGTGKTTILHMANSIWGDPVLLCGAKIDTQNAKIARMGILNNLPVTFDEMTNTKAEEFSELVYCMEQGRGKDRMTMSTNEIRSNAASWRTLSLCSSNASFYEKLAAYKRTPDGESMRLLEYKIEPTDAIDVGHAKNMFDHVLKGNFGHAGPIYAEWLVNNQEEAESTVLSLQAKFDAELKLTQRERIWSATIASNVAGGLIAKRLNLLDWDLHRIYRWVSAELLSMRQDVPLPSSDAAAVVGDYILHNIQSVLVVDGLPIPGTKTYALPIEEPFRELLIRYEPDTKHLYIVASSFKAFCSAQQVSHKDTLAELSARGVYFGSSLKRMTKGMKVGASAPTWVLSFDCKTEPEFAALGAGVVAGVTSAGRDS